MIFSQQVRLVLGVGILTVLGTGSLWPCAAAESAPKKVAPGSEVANKSLILSLQHQELAEQETTHDDEIVESNNFTEWMDEHHRKLYLKMDNTVRLVDTMWAPEEKTYDPSLSFFRLKLYTRYGGRSNDDAFEFKFRFSGDFALPGLQNRLHLVLDNAGGDSLPGTDPLQKEDDFRLALNAVFNTMKGNDFTVSGGLRWRDSHPVVFGTLTWRFSAPLAGGDFVFRPRGYYYTDDGFGQQTIMTWTRQLGEKVYMQSRTAERTSESLDAVEFEQTLRFAWLRSGKGRGWVAQFSVFPHIQSSHGFLDDSLINVSWRDALYRKWIYYTIKPQVQFPVEDSHQAKPSIHFEIDILFGGKIGSLL